MTSDLRQASGPGAPASQRGDVAAGAGSGKGNEEEGWWELGKGEPPNPDWAAGQGGDGSGVERVRSEPLPASRRWETHS